MISCDLCAEQGDVEPAEYRAVLPAGRTANICAAHADQAQARVLKPIGRK